LLPVAPAVAWVMSSVPIDTPAVATSWRSVMPVAVEYVELLLLAKNARTSASSVVVVRLGAVTVVVLFAVVAVPTTSSGLEALTP
jgi:hypothetical protein